MKVPASFLLAGVINFCAFGNSLNVISSGDSMSAATEIAAVSDAPDQSQFLFLDSIKSQKHYHAFYFNYRGGLEDFNGFGIYHEGVNCTTTKVDSIIGVSFDFCGCPHSPHQGGGGWISVRRAFLDIQNFGDYKGIEMEYCILYLNKGEEAPVSFHLTICDIGKNSDGDKKTLTDWKNKGYDYMWWSKDITLDITKDRINHDKNGYKFNGQKWRTVKFPFYSFTAPPDYDGTRRRDGKLDLWRVTAYEVNLQGCGIGGCFIFRNVQVYK